MSRISRLLILGSLVGWLYVPLEGAAMESAKVILLRGTAKTDAGQLLKASDAVPYGSTVSTAARSFVKLQLANQTQLSIGPDSSMKIETFQKDQPNLVNLVTGQIRAKVTKGLRSDEDAAREKLIIRTQSASFGIRGTELLVSHNEANGNSGLVTLEGLVVMAGPIEGTNPAVFSAAFEAGGTLVGAGQFSAARPGLEIPPPVLISPAQVEVLTRNETLEAGIGGRARPEAFGSPVPPGLDPRVLATESRSDARVGESPSVATGPRSGGFVDLMTAMYIPPPAGSAFDSNTGLFVPPTAMGSFDLRTGEYVPPRGIALDPVLGFVPEVTAVRFPSGQMAAGSQPASPVSAETSALVAALNQTLQTDAGTGDVTFTPLFAPGNGQSFVPPPPAGNNADPPPGNNLPPPREPQNDPTCVNCNERPVSAPAPQSSSVTFSIQVN